MLRLPYFNTMTNEHPLRAPRVAKHHFQPKDKFGLPKRVVALIII